MSGTIDEIGKCFMGVESREEQDKCVERARDEFEELGRGTDRFVFALNDGRVVKFPVHDGKAETNLQEAENWEGISEETYASDHLAETFDVADDGSWLVMERADVPDYNSGAERPFDAIDLTQLRLAKGEWVCQDVRPSNFGENEDGWKMIDYPHCRGDQGIDRIALELGLPME